MSRQRLVGFWTLASWTRLGCDGSERPQFEEPIAGFLVYGDDGHMAVSIFEREKPRLITAYGGRYEVTGDEVAHHPLVGNSPAGVDAVKRRRVAFCGATLRLETGWLEDGGETCKFRLYWSKNT